MDENNQRLHLLFTELVTRFEAAVKQRQDATREKQQWPGRASVILQHNEAVDKVERLRTGLIDAFTVQLNEVEEAHKQ